MKIIFFLLHLNVFKANLVIEKKSLPEHFHFKWENQWSSAWIEISSLSLCSLKCFKMDDCLAFYFKEKKCFVSKKLNPSSFLTLTSINPGSSVLSRDIFLKTGM